MKVTSPRHEDAHSEVCNPVSGAGEGAHPRIMPIPKRPRDKTTVAYQERTLPVEYFSTFNSSKKRFRIRFTVEGCRERDISLEAPAEHHGTLTEAEVQKAVRDHLGKHPLALPRAKEDEGLGAGAGDAGEEGGPGRNQRAA